MSHVFNTSNIICFSMRQLSSSWKNLASTIPLLGPTVKHSLKAVVVHNIILVLVSIRVIMKNKCFVSHWYSITLYCCFSPGSRFWKAQGHFRNTVYEFGIPAIQSVCVRVCVCARVHADTHEHACRCICDNAHAWRLMYWHCSLWKTYYRTINNTKICTISGSHIVEVEDSGHLGCYTVWQS